MSWREMSLWFRSRKYSQKSQEEMYLSCEKKRLPHFLLLLRNLWFLIYFQIWWCWIVAMYKTTQVQVSSIWTFVKYDHNASIYVMLWAIWYHLYNLKNVKNTHGGVLLLVELQALASNFTKSNILLGRFLGFLYCTNGTKSRNTPHV